MAKSGVTVHIEAGLAAPNAGQCIDEHEVLLGVIVKLRKAPFAFFDGDVLLAHDQYSTEDMFCEMVRHWAPHAGEAPGDRHTTLDITQRCIRRVHANFRERPHPFKSFRKDPHAILCSSNAAPSATCGSPLQATEGGAGKGYTRIMRLHGCVVLFVSVCQA